MATTKSCARRSTADSVQVTDWEHDVPGSLSANRKTYVFPSIYGKTTHGKTTEWIMTVRLYSNLDDATADRKQLAISQEIARNIDKTTPCVARLLVFYRVEDEADADKESQKRVPTFVTTSKNIGRSNETNVFCQALRQAYGLYNKQLRNVGSLTSIPAASEIDAAAASVSAASSSSAAASATVHAVAPADDNIEIISAETPLPMLAQPYDDVYETTDNPSPIYVQRKYNGVRAIGTLIDDMPVLYSRKGLIYTGFAAIKNDVDIICKAWQNKTLLPENCGVRQSGKLYLDGELYLHGLSLQNISGLVRRAKKDLVEQEKLQFMVYDVFVVNQGNSSSNNLTFDDRFTIMRAIARSTLGAQQLCRIVFAETFTCVNDPAPSASASSSASSSAAAQPLRAIDKARDLYRQFLSEGFEGAIVRINAAYQHSACNYHSRVLLKIKPTRDAEFEIAGFTCGAKGRAAGALLFVCKTAGGQQFNITPMGTIESRIAQYRDFSRVEENGRTVFVNHWLGRPLIVFFDEVSNSGVPQRARTEGTIRTCD